jgi:hypothetical protein
MPLSTRGLINFVSCSAMFSLIPIVELDPAQYAEIGPFPA